MAAVTDSFNRADSTTTMGNADSGQTWVPNLGTWGILSNLAYLVTPDGQATTVVESFVGDCIITVTLATVADAGLCWRSTDTNNHYILSGSTGTVYRKQAGGFTSLGSTTAWSNGDTAAVILAGSSHFVQKNGVTVISYTDAFNRTATKHGLRANSTAVAKFNDFSVAPAPRILNAPIILQAVRRAATR